MQKIEFKPIFKVPRGSLGEKYLQLWREYVEKTPSRLMSIFQACTSFDSRDASVAASFIAFMGTSVGQGFTDEALILSKSEDLSTENAFLASWAINNRRVQWRNYSLRICEFMLARDNPVENGAVNYNNIPHITLKDMDVLECMVAWWSSPDAEKLRKTAKELALVNG